MEIGPKRHMFCPDRAGCGLNFIRTDRSIWRNKILITIIFEMEHNYGVFFVRLEGGIFLDCETLASVIVLLYSGTVQLRDND